LAGEGWGEGVSLELPPHLNPFPKGRGRSFFPLFVQIDMSLRIFYPRMDPKGKGFLKNSRRVEKFALFH